MKENPSKAIFHEVPAEINIPPHLAVGSGEPSRRKKPQTVSFTDVNTLLSLPVASGKIPRDAGHSESPWATRTAPRTTRWVSGSFSLNMLGNLDFPESPLQPGAEAKTQIVPPHLRAYGYLCGHSKFHFQDDLIKSSPNFMICKTCFLFLFCAFKIDIILRVWHIFLGLLPHNQLTRVQHRR